MKKRWMIGIGLASLLTAPIAIQSVGGPQDAGPTGMRTAQAAQRQVNVTSRSRLLQGREVGEVLVNGDVVFRIRTGAGGYTAPQRAQIAADRLADVVNRGNLSADDVRQAFMNGERVLMANGELLVTADRYHAEANGTTTTKLATTWENNLEKALLGPEAYARRNNGSGRYGSASIQDVRPDLASKIVPILSAGTGVRLGAAQVTGPKRDVDDVKAVAEIETEWKRTARARLYVPVSDLNILKGIDRVPRVGVSGLADVRLKF